MMNKYFISFQADKSDGKSFFGNTIVKRDRVQTEEDIRDIERQISATYPTVNDTTILFFRNMED